jgi:signal transduction histidine kinase
VALREVPEGPRERLNAVRGAAARLQGVVSALLTLFRSGMELRLGSVDLATLLARIPAPTLRVQVQAGPALQADADLLAAALMNLIDNAQRHGASQVVVSQVQPGWVRVHDDGPGADAAHRAALRAELQRPWQADESAHGPRVGLGLALADRVARVHGGALQVPEVDAGFAVDLQLTAMPSAALTPLAQP